MKNIVCCVVMMLISFSLFSAELKEQQPLPPIKVQLDQSEIALSDYRGKVILLDFWASWCGPCRQSFPWMNDMQARYASQGLVVIAINLDKEKEDAQNFLSNIPANFEIGYDPEGHIAEIMNVMGMPMSYLIDQHGQIKQRLIGFNPKKQIEHEAHIQSLLAGSAR